MEKVRLYFVEAYDELMHKVTWPTWPELQDSAVVVLVTSLIMALVIVGMDLSFRFSTEFLYKQIIGN